MPPRTWSSRPCCAWPLAPWPSALGLDGAEAACDAAELALGELGLDAPGWRTVLALALAPSPAPV